MIVKAETNIQVHITLTGEEAAILKDIISNVSCYDQKALNHTLYRGLSSLPLPENSGKTRVSVVNNRVWIVE